MSFRTKQTRNLLTGTLLLSFGMLAFGVSARAEDPTAMIQKAQNLYAGAKSFQGTLRIVQTGKDQKGAAGVVNSTQKVAFKAPNFFLFDVKAKGTGAAAAAAQGDSLMVCDGKTVFRYMSAQKQYIKQAAPPTFSMMQVIGRLLPQMEGFSPAGTSDANVGGQSAVIIKMKAQMPKNLPPSMTSAQKAQLEQQVKTAQPILVTLNKKNYQLLRVQITGQGTSVDINFADQSFSPNVPMTLFKFTPPAGSKEFKAPTNPGR